MTTPTELLATPEELAARKAKAAAEAQASLSPAEALVAAHDHIGDDDLAERIAAHPDVDIFLALWRRIAGAEHAIAARLTAQPTAARTDAPQDAVTGQPATYLV